LIKYHAAVIGLGQIGQGYDYNDSKSNAITTHCSAYYSHPSFELVGAVDIDDEKRMLFEKKYEINSFSSVSELFKSTPVDIISICVPTEFHYDSFIELVDFNIKTVICEKPFSGDIKTAKKMVEISKKQNIKLIVNYIRRFNKNTIDLKNKIKKNVIGNVKSGRVWYCNGLLNNGSHFIDLLIYLFGPPSDVSLIQDDPIVSSDLFEPNFYLNFGDTSIHFFSTRTNAYSFVELDLIGSEGRIRYTNENVYYYKVNQHKYFNKTNYLKLVNKKELGLNNYQLDVMNVVDDCMKGAKTESNGETALMTLDVINEIKSQSEFG